MELFKIGVLCGNGTSAGCFQMIQTFSDCDLAEPGFFVGAIGAFSEGTKQGILVSGSLLLCFLSGLMVGNMWIIVENTCPVINRISPAALISRAFYTLGIQDNLNQYYQCILTLVGISALFCLGGFLLTRRKRYASI